jgi:hypothetical protein
MEKKYIFIRRSFAVCTYHLILLGWINRKSRMDKACSTYSENKKSYGSLVENVKGRFDLGKHGNWSKVNIKMDFGAVWNSCQQNGLLLAG